MKGNRGLVLLQLRDICCHRGWTAIILPDSTAPGKGKVELSQKHFLKKMVKES
jgi:hypothetical protein